MTQNIYDDADFYARYGRLIRSMEGLDGAAEWPAMQALLPPLQGLSVVDLGCGYGWFCRWARAAGAVRVLGLDVSARMLERARADTADAAIAYESADLERLELPEAAFDLGYSSLAFHYVADAARLYRRIHASLAPGGRLVFSTEHPIYMAPNQPGWRVGEDGEKTWPLDGYLKEGPRTTDWLGAKVLKHHRTIGATLNLLIAAGFAIEHVEEFAPSPAQIAARPSLAEELERPMFLLVSARR